MMSAAAEEEKGDPFESLSQENEAPSTPEPPPRPTEVEEIIDGVKQVRDEEYFSDKVNKHSAYCLFVVNLPLAY